MIQQFYFKVDFEFNYNLIDSGSAAYIDGGILYCGGVYLHDASASALKSCYILKHLALQWEETLPLLQVRIVSKISARADGGPRSPSAQV